MRRTVSKQRKEEQASPNKERQKNLLKVSTRVLFFLGISFLGTVFGVYRAIVYNLPDIAEIENFEPGIITSIYADNGEVIGEYALEKRIKISYGDLPDMLVKAIIATEDPRFFQHTGIDFWGILRALKEDVKLFFSPQKLQGGSTITQQLVRELLLHRKQTLRRKLKEIILALRIEKRYTKEEILTIYCNQFNLGHGAYGVEAASRIYFGKSVLDLNLEECAMIAGIFRGPNRYSPYRNYDLTQRRRNHVINRMIEEKFIAQEAGESIKKKNLSVLPLQRTDSDFAAYFNEEIRRYLYSNYGEEALYERGLKVYTTLNVDYQRYAENAVTNWLRILDKRQGWRDDKPNLLEMGIADLEEITSPVRDEQSDKLFLESWQKPFLDKDSLMEAVVLSAERREARVKIKEYTGKLTGKGIDWTKTNDLRTLIKRGDIIHIKIKDIDEEEKKLQVDLDQEPLLEAAFLAIEPQTGQIKAMVGGYSFQRSEWNNATQALRQAGSVIKPILYTAALENGLTTVSTFIDEPTDFEDKWSGEIWSPPNYDEKYKGRVTLRQGIEESRNIVTAKMLDHISPQAGVDYCKKFGIASPVYPYLSLSLGAFEVTMIELVSAFTVFPNQGIRVEPFFISRIEDREGNILEETKIDSEEVISPQMAYIMTNLLQGVVQRGTAQAVKSLEMPLAGKTGTTDDFADARFIGFSPSLCAGVWVGHREARAPIGDRQSGAVAALPMWIDFFKQVIEEEKRMAKQRREEWEPGREFSVASNLSFVEIDRKTGLLPSPVCLPQFIIKEVLLPGTEPKRFCSHEDHMMTYDYYETLRRTPSP